MQSNYFIRKINFLTFVFKYSKKKKKCFNYIFVLLLIILLMFIFVKETSNMNLQMFSEFEKIKDNMINTAKKCFETANKVN